MERRGLIWQALGVATTTAIATLFSYIAVYQLATAGLGVWTTYLWLTAAALTIFATYWSIRKTLQEDKEHDDES